MRREESSLKDAIESLPSVAPLIPNAASYELGWMGLGLQAVRYRDSISNEVSAPPTSQHALALITRAPEEMNLQYEGVKRDIPPAAGSVALIPAGVAALWRWQGSKDSLHIYLDPSLVARVAGESFELDPTRTVVPLLDGFNAPELVSAMLAVNAELRAGGVGGSLLVESLATILSVHLLRHTMGWHRLPASADGVLPRQKLRTVIEYIMENLGGSPTLEQMAAVAHLSPYHFARQFKAATGLPPHQYVIARRVERAQQLLRGADELGLAEVALRTGFADQSHFSFHFKRIVGVTPRSFSFPQESSKRRQKRRQASARNRTLSSVSMLLKQDAYQLDRVAANKLII
jgi:AraC family transcriptional regulator